MFVLSPFVQNFRAPLLQGFRWDTATTNAVCDLDAVAVFFDDNVSSYDWKVHIHA